MFLKSVFPEIYEILERYNLKEDKLTREDLFYLSDIFTKKGDLAKAHVFTQLAIAHKDRN